MIFKKHPIRRLLILFMTVGLASLIISVMANNYKITPTEPTFYEIAAQTTT